MYIKIIGIQPQPPSARVSPNNKGLVGSYEPPTTRKKPVIIGGFNLWGRWSNLAFGMIKRQASGGISEHLGLHVRGLVMTTSQVVGQCFTGLGPNKSDQLVAGFECQMVRNCFPLFS